jgi:drug/metabolite transporter (DMT)-like permease
LNLRDVILTGVALLIFASAYALIRICLMELPPITLAAVRFTLASLLMVPLAFAHYRGAQRKFVFGRLDFVVLFALASSQIFMPNLLQNIGLEYTTASVSSILQSTTPIFTILLSFMFLKENVTSREVFGASMAMVGIVLLSTGGDFISLGESVFIGNALQVGVAASYAVSGIIGKVLLKKYEPMYVVTLCFVIGGLMLSSLAVVFERNLWPSSLSNEVIGALFLLSFLYCLALVSWYEVLQRTSVSQLYVLLFTMPVLAVTISIIVLGESFTFLDIAFSAVILIGVAITQLGKVPSA